ncbi:unnamed protein product [Parnassius mnemosyne]|uniref:Ig-like domain-containing protein n=1 Tax=Parnassius mnemosyne TaxID=213953 RepID=A0AAV1KDT1_9NEOP
MYVALFIFSADFQKGAGAVQRFAELPKYTEVNPGEDALLTCRISDKKGICSWQKDNKPVGIYRGKYEWANEHNTMSGDCSLWVRAASLQLDDGQWQCQVTASNYNVQDALSSAPAALAVRVPPQTPRILFNGSHVLPGQNITVAAGSRATVVCEARYGNPPAYIEWYLDKESLTAWSHTNTSEAERPRMWAARSVLEMNVPRSAHGKHLTCRAHHPSFPPPYYRDSFTKLDVTFVPVVSIIGADATELSSLEENTSLLSLDCQADGNPKPYVWWTRNGQVFATGPKLKLTPVMRNHSGTYGCQARNSLGTSDSVKIDIDVKFPPRVKWVGPDIVVDTNLFSEVTLECNAEANPSPVYQWYHSPGTRTIHNLFEDAYLISSTAQLQLHNVSYHQNGQYICIAKNLIGHKERSHRSEAVTLNVLGPPVGIDTGVVHAWSGGEAKVQATVCADPPPDEAVWLWSHFRLEVPSQIGKYGALDMEKIDGCYRYILSISYVEAADARDYVLHVENERGFSSLTVSLIVHENFSVTETMRVAPMIAAALVISALLVLVLCFLVRCRRKRDSVEYKTDELDSDIKVLPADALYGSQATCPMSEGNRQTAAGTVSVTSVDITCSRYSPAALEVRRAAVVLQPPTTV